MMGADIGVGNVTVDEVSIVADLGYERSGEEVLGVIRDRLRGEFSMRALREDVIGGVLSDLSLALETLDCRRGAGSSLAGITRGVNRRAQDCETGAPKACGRRASSIHMESSSPMGNLMSLMKIGARCLSSLASSGALAERSWRGGRPGIVAIPELAVGSESSSLRKS